MRCLTFVSFVILVAGCSHVPLSSAIRLHNINPLTADPQHFQIAVRMPEGLSVRKDGAVMLVGARRADIDAEASQRFVFEKTAAKTAAGTDGLEPEADTHIEVFQIADADVERLRALQQTIKAWKAAAPDDTKGSLSIQASGCRRSHLPEGRLIVSTFLRTDPDRPFFMITRNVDLRPLVEKDGEPFVLPPCLVETP